MRLSIEDIYGDDPVKIGLVCNADVLLDGVKVENCVMADEEKGEVIVHAPEGDPRWALLSMTLEIPTDIKYGKVQIVDRRKVGFLHA